MFRRKGEDNLFDTPTDQPMTESATAEQPAASPATTASPLASPTSSVVPPSGQPNSPLARPAAMEPRPEMRPASQPSSFRPAASPLAGDMSRNRMPEAKPVTPAAPTSSMAMGMSMSIDKTGNKSGRRVLTVGNDILLKGEIATCDRLVIEGKVDATLNDVHTVEISETGSFKGSANIEDAEISGLFEGDLVVRNRLVIYATGKVRGKITYGEIEIERGGELTGEIKTTTPQSNTSRPTRSGTKTDKMEAA